MKSTDELWVEFAKADAKKKQAEKEFNKTKEALIGRYKLQIGAVSISETKDLNPKIVKTDFGKITQILKFRGSVKMDRFDYWANKYPKIKDAKKRVAWLEARITLQ